MPTATKKPASKKTPTKKAPVKKAAPKRAPAKSTSATKVHRVSRPVKSDMQSLRCVPRDEPFMTFRINRQTIYWLILGAMVISLATWVLAISIEVQNIYDQVDVLQAEADSMVVKKKQ